MAKTYTGDKTGSSFIINVNKPVDVRTVVDTVTDLTNGSIPNPYAGLVVNIKGTGDLYVLTTGGKGASNINNWKKVGEVGEIDPEDYLTYYQEKLGAVILDSVSGLSSIESPFIGQFAYVKDDPNSSEDESALYVYNGSNWIPISTGGGSSTDMSTVITTDGIMPTSGSGITVSNDAEGAFIEETYVDDYLHAGVYYSTHGINSSKDNGGSELEGINYIILSNGGDSWIKISSRGVMTLLITDDSLGFNAENIVGIISNDREYINPYEGRPYPGSQLMFSLGLGDMIKFDIDVDFTGFTETRDDDSTEYIFGQTGSEYKDIDFYSTTVLPTVYAYSDNTPVRVLTEGDKVEIINKIDEVEPETISNEDIMDLF